MSVQAASKALAEAEQIIRREAECAATEKRAEAVARLIWDHAHDREFLLMALPEEIRGREAVPAALTQTSYFVRCVLHFIADELAYQCPDRGAYEEDVDDE